ncbi:hypothetical protein COOONC_19140 [Cooperia oncophora]
MTGSFLEYVFRKCQGDNVRESLEPRWHLKITFDDTTSMMAPYEKRAKLTMDSVGNNVKAIALCFMMLILQ